MSVSLLIAADLIDFVANPSRTIEEQETGAARLAMLASHNAPIDSLSLEGISEADVNLLSGHVCRWALNQAKQTTSRGAESRLPRQVVLQELFNSESDRVCRLLFLESVMTHPETERKLAEFDECDEPIPLDGLADAWPRNYLIELSRREDSETDHQAEADLTELGMLLLQIATPAALTLLGGTVMTLRQHDKEDHSLIGILRTFVSEREDELALRLGLRSRPERFA
jgi:hypothetical protein